MEPDDAVSVDGRLWDVATIHEIDAMQRSGRLKVCRASSMVAELA
jgi:hypothetical protein